MGMLLLRPSNSRCSAGDHRGDGWWESEWWEAHHSLSNSALLSRTHPSDSYSLSSLLPLIAPLLSPSRRCRGAAASTIQRPKQYLNFYERRRSLVVGLPSSVFRLRSSSSVF